MFAFEPEVSEDELILSITSNNRDNERVLAQNKRKKRRKEKQSEESTTHKTKRKGVKIRRI